MKRWDNRCEIRQPLTHNVPWREETTATAVYTHRDKHCCSQGNASYHKAVFVSVEMTTHDIHFTESCSFFSQLPIQHTVKHLYMVCITPSRKLTMTQHSKVVEIQLKFSRVKDVWRPWAILLFEFARSLQGFASSVIKASPNTAAQKDMGGTPYASLDTWLKVFYRSQTCPSAKLT